MAIFEKEINDALAAPLDRAHVKEREQSGRKFSYIEGWLLISEANRIFGFDGWTRETVDVRMLSERERKIGKAKDRDGWSVSYSAKVRVVVHGEVIREGIGAGHGIDADIGLAHESAVKEAETDAMKRALMTFGNPFGLALYDKEQTNVADVQAMETALAVEKELQIAAENGTGALKQAWMKLDNKTRNLFGGTAPAYLKETAAKRDGKAA